jgi:hypothetical protein
MWRRNHLEGTIDNRWNVLRLEKDDETGMVMILECRKEFLTWEKNDSRRYTHLDYRTSSCGRPEMDGPSRSSLPTEPWRRYSSDVALACQTRKTSDYLGCRE